MAEPFFILLGKDFDSRLTGHFLMSPDDNRYTINKQAATQNVPGYRQIWFMFEHYLFFTCQLYLQLGLKNINKFIIFHRFFLHFMKLPTSPSVNQFLNKIATYLP